MIDQRQFNLPLWEVLKEERRAEALQRDEQTQKLRQDRRDDIDLDEDVPKCLLKAPRGTTIGFKVGTIRAMKDQDIRTEITKVGEPRDHLRLSLDTLKLKPFSVKS
ncbi:hypothetical protein HAX54_009338 [Datura stramonium]|uniref:Uncharacterized protein n=1 Tax=Datura stramonium TaxID=4076 RepID=A0ABS8TGI9_DATST|nr:hypothetical protein [Datura stramonium]